MAFNPGSVLDFLLTAAPHANQAFQQVTAAKTEEQERLAARQDKQAAAERQARIDAQQEALRDLQIENERAELAARNQPDDNLIEYRGRNFAPGEYLEFLQQETTASARPTERNPVDYTIRETNNGLVGIHPETLDVREILMGGDPVRPAAPRNELRRQALTRIENMLASRAPRDQVNQVMSLNFPEFSGAWTVDDIIKIERGNPALQQRRRDYEAATAHLISTDRIQYETEAPSILGPKP